MTETLIALVVLLAVAAFAYWAGHKLAEAFGLPAPILVLFDILIVAVVLLYLLRLFKLSPV
jgi:hypothetical protein